MNNIIKANIKMQNITTYTCSAWQYDYGQILQITGAELPQAVEVQFSLYEKSGQTITRVATTTDGVTEVQIPNELLKREGCERDYFIYAYIFVSDEKSGNTIYKIAIAVKKRPKPEEPTDEPEQEENLFHATVVAVNAAADRAEQALGDVEEIRDNLNLDLSEKITRPDTAKVGQVLAVKEIDESGKPTVFEAEDVKVPTTGSDLDVRINGQSIVQDGVAEIPLIKGSSPGLVTVDYYATTGGLTRANEKTGLIRIFSARKTEIDSRSNYCLPIPSPLLDYAVKAAMCDGKGAAWTAEEQAAARERMRIDEWELFADIALEEKVRKISFTIENWKELFVRIDAKAVQDTVSTTILYPFTNANFCDFYPGTGKDASIYVHMVKFDDCAFYEISFNNKSGNSGTPKSSIVKRTHNFLNFTRDYFESGTTAKVWIMR